MIVPKQGTLVLGRKVAAMMMEMAWATGLSKLGAKKEGLDRAGSSAQNLTLLAMTKGGPWHQDVQQPQRLLLERRKSAYRKPALMAVAAVVAAATICQS